MPTLDANQLINFTSSLFESAGVPLADARLVATSLVGANLRGHDSHGVMRAPQYLGFLEKGDYQAGVDLKVDHETEAVVSADGQWGLGQVQAHRLLDLVIPKARRQGIAAGAARHCGHIGRLGEYAERAAEEGLILIATVNNCGAGQRVAPPGGVEPRLGTNPLCAGVPTGGDEPLILDFGTSVAAEGKVRSYYFNKQQVPEGWLLDNQGQPTTNPAVLYETPLGSILPMGGAQAYKGFGLALVLDLLAGGLSGGRSSYAGAPAARGNNVVFLALDSNAFAGSETLLGEASQLAAFVRQTPRAPGVESILLPGDPERRTLAQRLAQGIPIPEAHWAKLTEQAQLRGLEIPAVV